MRRLKIESLKKCVSLLRELNDCAGPADEKKKMADLVLKHLENITAGTSEINISCTYKPRIDGT